MRKGKGREAEMLWRPCRTVKGLGAWLNYFLGMKVPVRAVCAGHQAPMEYLRRAYFEPGGDLVVWAPRGGGKTRLGAVATLLDLLHKPGCQVRILGGSLEQSMKMWEHLMPDVRRLAEGAMEGEAKGRKVVMGNGSAAAVLTQSERAVRGLRVQKLRCDEVELFDEGVWEAAQLVTKSREGKGFKYVGAVEAISTLHTPYGLMQRVVERAEGAGVPVIRWCLMEVLGKCEADRECDKCALREECRGVAKTKCEGFVSIDDAIAMKKRVSEETWEAEMLCRRPSRRHSVFPNFDREIHVREEMAEGGGGEMTLAIDFGFANPFACLWVREDEEGRVFVVDEYVQPGRTVEEHVRQIEGRGWGKVRKVACDPAGAGRNEQTAMSNVEVLRRAGYAVKFRKSLILEGVEMVRAGLKPGAGEARLFIHPRCRRLIRAMESYRYAEGGSELPLKDGEHDHLIDALRYYYVNHSAGEGGGGRRY